MSRKIDGIRIPDPLTRKGSQDSEQGRSHERRSGARISRRRRKAATSGAMRRVGRGMIARFLLEAE